MNSYLRENTEKKQKLLFIKVVHHQVCYQVDYFCVVFFVKSGIFKQQSLCKWKIGII